VSAWLQEAEYIAAKSEIEKSESQLMERDNMMSTMQEELARAREEAQSNQEALLRAMEEMHVKEDKDEDDQEHGGSGITIDFCLPGYRVLFFAPFCLHLYFICCSFYDVYTEMKFEVTYVHMEILQDLRKGFFVI